MLTALTGTSGSTFGEANVRERAAAILRSASSIHARRSRTNRTMSCCGMRAGAVTSTAPYGGLTRRYMLRFFLRSTLTCTPSTVMTSREISACGEVERPASERARGGCEKAYPILSAAKGTTTTRRFDLTYRMLLVFFFLCCVLNAMDRARSSGG